MEPLRATDDERFTYADYLEWDGPERWELDDGVPVLMSPAPTVRHQTIVARLIVAFSVYLRGRKCRVLPAPLDVLLPEGDEPDEEVRNLLQPDLVVVCDERKVQHRNIRGGPDLVVEVLSRSSAQRDRPIKRARYERAGVREYWMIDAEAGRVEVLVRDDAAGGWAEGGAARVFEATSGAIPVAILPGLTLDAGELLAPA